MGRRKNTAPDEHSKPKRHVGRLLLRLAAYALILTAVASLVLSVGTTVWAKALHGNAQVVVVTSNSMVPEFSARDVLAVRPVDPADLKVGDIVTMERPSGTMVTHRIIEIERHGDQYHLHTQGDANNTPDADIALGDQVVGVVDGQIPQIGEVLVWAQSNKGRLITLAPAAVLLVVLEVVHLWRPRPEDEETPTPVATEPTAPHRPGLPPLPSMVVVTAENDTAATPQSKRYAKAQAKAAAQAAKAAARQAAIEAKVAKAAAKARRKVTGETAQRPVYLPVVDPSKPRGRHRTEMRATRRR